MKKIISTFIGVFCAIQPVISASLAEYYFTESSNEASATSDGIAASPLDKNEGVTSYASGNPDEAISASGWTGSEEEARYWTFTIWAEEGSLFDLDRLEFDHRRTASGPANWRVQIDIEDQAHQRNTFQIGSGTGALDGNYQMLSFDLTSHGLPDHLHSATVILSGWNASSGGGTWRLDNVILSGQVTAITPVPEPSTWSLIGLGGLLLAARELKRGIRGNPQ